MIDSIVITVLVSEPSVEINDIEVRQDDLIFTARQATLISLIAPPVEHIIFLNGEINIFIGPVDNFFGFADVGSVSALLLLAVVGC